MKKILVIKESKWCRKYPFRHDGKMCALGFLGMSPHWRVRNKMGCLWSSRVVCANDDLRGKKRKEVLRAMFKEADLSLRFVK